MSASDTADSDARFIEIYDTTLRDGTQGEGVSFSLLDKLKIAQFLNDIGVDYIEGGYPLSNPKDAAFFEEVRKLNLDHARVCAFGMTRRRGMKPADDVGMQALIDACSPIITIVGKTWDLHVTEVLGVSLDENLEMIQDTIEYCGSAAGPDGSTEREMFYDAEHFFDGYRANAEYAIKTLEAAVAGGATRLILCDTNGGSLPDQIAQIVDSVRSAIGGRAELGIHVHNDGGLAVANTLKAIEHGCLQVQGTINGIGERCGNVDLIPIVANLSLKLQGYRCLYGEASVRRLTECSRLVYELANMNLLENQPFVGTGAFAHKGGMHVHAVQKVAHSYEHIPPDTVGNSRRVLVSELSGGSNIKAVLGDKFNVSTDRELQRKILSRIQDLENAGYQFEAANASFELLVRREVGLRRDYWSLDHYRCVILKVDSQESSTEAIVKLKVGQKVEHQVADGDGPVDSLVTALRKCLLSHYPELAKVHLSDYKVRVVNATAETAAKVRVIIDFAIRNGGGTEEYFSTIGVNENIVEASWDAIIDAFEYYLLELDVSVNG